MPASLVRKLGTQSGTGTQSITVAAGGAAAGDLVVVGIGNDTATLSSVTDSAGGNTYSLGARSVGQNAECALYYSILVNPIPGGGTITVNLASGITIIAAATFTGIIASPLDKTHGNSGAAATSLTTGATTATAQADELAIGWFYAGNLPRNFTQGGSYTLLDSVNDAANGQSAGWEYLVLSATGAQTATGTESGGINYDAVIVTFKATASVSPTSVAPGGLPGMGLSRSPFVGQTFDPTPTQTSFETGAPPVPAPMRQGIFGRLIGQAVPNTGAAGSTFVITTSDAISFTETATLIKTAVVAPADNIAFTEAATLVKTAKIASADNITFAEAATLVRTAILSPSSSLRFTETVALVAARILVPTTSLSFAEVTALVKNAIVNPASTITFAETVNLVVQAAAAPTRIARGFAPAILAVLERWR